jgi:hypothetical protein
MHLGHAVEADARSRIFAFAGAWDQKQAGGVIDQTAVK